MCVTRMFRRQLILLALLSLTANYAVGQGIDDHLGLGYNTGNSVGLDDGYTHFDAWLPVWQPSEGSVVFSDTRLLLYNEQSEALGANIGLGGRCLDPNTGRIWGTYLYYDYRDTGLADFNQISWGFENLGQDWDTRAHAYLPLENNSAQVGLSPRFDGQNIYLDSLTQQALRGWDAELGRVIYRNTGVQVRAMGGIYGYSGSNSADAWGGRARIECRVKDQLWLGGYVQNDEVFDTTGGFQISWRYGAGRRGECASACALACRLGDPVYRQQHIVIAQQVLDTGTLATLGGSDIEVLHVNSAAPGGGTGGIDDPVNNLTAASNQPENIVYVHGGSTFTGQQMIINTADQRFLAEGVPHLVVSDQGEFLLPEVNGGPAPVIDQSPSSGIGIGFGFGTDGVEVSGFTITDPTFAGISANNIDRFNINRNTISGATSGIEFTGMSGGGAISDNTMTGNSSHGIFYDGNFTGQVHGNLANGNGGFGFLFTGNIVGDVIGNTMNDSVAGNGFQLFGNMQGNLADNNANNNGAIGIAVNGDLTGNVSGNTVNDNLSHGLILGSNVIGNVTGNTTNNNVGDGLVVNTSLTGNTSDNTSNDNTNRGFVAGSINGNFTNNSADGNTSEGVLVFGNMTGDVSGNTSNNNGLTGMFFVSDLTGNIANNTTNDNGAEGIRVNGLLLGDLVDNTANRNTIDGLVVLGDLTGNILGNTANTNQVGIRVNGTVTGDVSQNRTDENTLFGIQLEGSLIGNLNLNTANNNPGEGIRLGSGATSITGNISQNTTNGNGEGIRAFSVVNGDVAGNTANNNNLGDGLFFNSDLNGNLINNTANNNFDDGIDVNGTISGAIGGNTTVGNGDLPIEN